MNNYRIAPLALAMLVAIGGGLAIAKGNSRQDARDAAALATMKLTLPQAIAAAEQSAGGRAVAADITGHGGKFAVKVEIAGPQGTKTVLVDGQTGQVAAAGDTDGARDADSNGDGGADD